MNNREWLYSLDAADLADWFDAEHAEGIIVNNYVTKTPSNIRNGLGYKDRPPHEKSEECKRFERELDAELVEIDDSREKLEADVHQYANPSGCKGTLGACWEKEMLSFLDRQAAITRRECEHDREALDYYADRYAEMDEQMVELAAERDEWKAKAEQAQATIDRMQEVIDGYVESTTDLETEIDKLKAKSAKRAVAVERLRGMVLNTGSAIKKLAIALDVKWNPDNAPLSMAVLQNTLIDLLTDDESYRQYADQGERDKTPDCENDSREKLEDDVVHECARPGFGPEFGEIMAWLDRQAAIAERETKLRELYKFEENHRYHIRSIEEVNQKLNKRIAELTAERDGLKAQVNSWRERNGDNMAMVDSLAKQVNELRAERDELTNAINELQKKQPYCYNPEQPMGTLNTIGRYIDELTAERDALADDLLTCNKEREEYRDLFSKSLTLADEIVNLQP